MTAAALVAGAAAPATAGAAHAPAHADARAATAPVTQQTTTYTVRSGDTLAAIAARFNTSVSALVQANDIADPTLIYVGQQLTIPASTGGPGGEDDDDAGGDGTAATTYTVRSGDTLAAIAARHSVSVSVIVQANDIANPAVIHVGQVFTIPGTGGDGGDGSGDDGDEDAGGVPATYTVQPGDTLAAIAARFNTSVAVLAQSNRIANPALIHVGQVISIPGGSDSSPRGGDGDQDGGDGAAGFTDFSAQSAGDGQIDTQVDVRAGTHSGFDRFVIEFAAAFGQADYEIAYVDSPPDACGSGLPTTVAGDAYLVVRVHNSRIHDEQGNITIPEREMTTGLSTIVEAQEVCGFEAESVWVLGIDSRRAIRVSEVSNPHRLVVDVER